MQFIDRTSELALLVDHLTRPGPGMFVLYGRRRIGKSALLDHAIRGLPRAAFHVATRSTVTEELGRLGRTLADAWAAPWIRAQPPVTVEALLAWLGSVTEPSILVLDELPYLAESDPSFPGQLQAAWDRTLSRLPLKIVCCGSSVSVMESTFFGRSSPLFGRRTGQLRLGALPVHALPEAFPLPAPALLELAALFGGVPGYLQRLDPAQTLDDHLLRHLLRRGEPLYEEVPFLLREELREPRVYHAILASIASGSRKFSEISSKVGLDRANLSRYLGVLIDLELVEREVPVTEVAPDKSKRGIYRIADPFVATWFALVHPNRDELERGRAHEVLEKSRPLLQSHVQFAVEPVVRQLLQGPVLGHLLPFPCAHAGRQWSPRGEYDVVLLDDARRRAVVAEVKWTGRPVSPGLLADLRRRVAGDPALAGVDCTCLVVSRCGFTPDATDAGLVDVSRLRL